jgi:teichuronic acid biosynthesis glycosyltransferase TuaG
MKAAPSVSVIMPAFNCEQTVIESVRSIQGQQFVDWEAIVIDDHSDDNTPSIIKELSEKDPRIKLIHNAKNMGVSQARNIGINASRGDYIAFLDSDDKWLPDKLAQQVEILRSTDAPVCCSAYFVINESGKRIAIRSAPENISYAQLLCVNRIGNLTGIYNRRKYGNVFQAKCGHEDYAFWLSILRNSGKSAVGINVPLAEYRIRKNSLSKNKWRALMWTYTIFRRYEKLSIDKSIYYMARYVSANLVRNVMESTVKISALSSSKK